MATFPIIVVLAMHSIQVIGYFMTISQENTTSISRKKALSEKWNRRKNDE
jgi:hypothetical protein